MGGDAGYKLLIEDDDDYYGPPETGKWLLSLRVRVRSLAFAVTTMVCSVFIFCIVYSLVYNFEDSTSTQCFAINVLPSISAAIGGFSPQREVWKIAIVIHSVPRLMVMYVYLQYNLKIIGERCSIIVLLAAILNVTEILSLLGLSLFDSSHHYPMHKSSFVTFIITSELYMLVTLFIQECLRARHRSVSEQYSLKWKKCTAAINITFVMFAMYYFMVHNMDCPDYAYTKFALCEYIVVFSNMAYHYTAVWDFNKKYIVVGSGGLHIRNDSAFDEKNLSSTDVSII